MFNELPIVCPKCGKDESFTRTSPCVFKCNNKECNFKVTMSSKLEKNPFVTSTETHSKHFKVKFDYWDMLNNDMWNSINKQKCVKLKFDKSFDVGDTTTIFTSPDSHIFTEAQVPIGLSNDIVTNLKNILNLNYDKVTSLPIFTPLSNDTTIPNYNLACVTIESDHLELIRRCRNFMLKNDILRILKFVSIKSMNKQVQSSTFIACVQLPSHLLASIYKINDRYELISLNNATMTMTDLDHIDYLIKLLNNELPLEKYRQMSLKCLDDVNAFIYSRGNGYYTTTQVVELLESYKQFILTRENVFIDSIGYEFKISSVPSSLKYSDTIEINISKEALCAANKIILNVT